MAIKNYSDTILHCSNKIIKYLKSNTVLVLFHHIHNDTHFFAVEQDENTYYGFDIKDGLVFAKKYPITKWNPEEITDNDLPPAFTMEDALKLYL